MSGRRECGRARDRVIIFPPCIAAQYHTLHRDPDLTLIIFTSSLRSVPTPRNAQTPCSPVCKRPPLTPPTPNHPRRRETKKPNHLKLAPLNLLASSSSSATAKCPSPKAETEGRLGGRSPLSCRIASKVAQPGVLRSWKPSARSCVVATRQRRASSSCGGGRILVSWWIFLGGKGWGEVVDGWIDGMGWDRMGWDLPC